MAAEKQGRKSTKKEQQEDAWLNGNEPLVGTIDPHIVLTFLDHVVNEIATIEQSGKVFDPPILMNDAANRPFLTLEAPNYRGDADPLCSLRLSENAVKEKGRRKHVKGLLLDMETSENNFAIFLGDNGSAYVLASKEEVQLLPTDVHESLSMVMQTLREVPQYLQASIKNTPQDTKANKSFVKTLAQHISAWTPASETAKPSLAA